MPDYVDADAIMAMLEPEKFVAEPSAPGYLQYEEEGYAPYAPEGRYAGVPPGYANPHVYAGPLSRYTGAGSQYGRPVYSMPNLYAAPAPAPPVPMGPGTVGRPQFSDLSVRERVSILNKGRGASNVPDPRTAPLRGLADPASHANEDAYGVKYIRDNNKLRNKYQVSLGSTMMRRGQIFDTGRTKAFYRHKLGGNVGNRLTDEEKARPFAVKPRAQIGAAMLGRDHAENTQRWNDLRREWALESLIWVCAWDEGSKSASFYSHIGKIDKFHHSSFKAGAGVIGAGEWIVEKGKLLKISANSGHYRPPLEYLHRSVLYMAEAWRQDTVVLLWNIPKDSWEEVPVLMFRDNPSRNGTYKAHPSG